MSPTISVFGSAQPISGSPEYQQAQQLGRLLAGNGFVVLNGGYSGTMEGVSRGATEAGGRAIGITCALFDKQRPAGNPYLSAAIHTPDLLSRLRQLVERADGFAVLPGGVGTLLEVFLVWNLLAILGPHKPCVLIGSHWRRVLDVLEQETSVEPRHSDLLAIADSSTQAVEILVARLYNCT